jgi:hypothetical protein
LKEPPASPSPPVPCWCWRQASAGGLENNCTRKLSARNTYEIVVIKGLGAGTGALIIALLLGEKLPALSYGFTALCLGFTAYGLSIFAYVRAQHGIGALRLSLLTKSLVTTGGFFSTIKAQKTSLFPK